MSVELSKIHNNLPNNKVIVVEKRINNNETTENFYLTDSDKADQFIKTKETNEFSDKFQKGLTIGASCAVGYLVGTGIKNSNFLLKLVSGITSAIGSLIGFSAIDVVLNKFLNKQAMKKFNATEVTKEEVQKITSSQE